MRHFSSPSSLYAAAIVDAWSDGDGERLSQGLAQVGTLRFEGMADAGECERGELLKAIADTIRGAGGPGARERCSTYIPMLKHLARPVGRQLIDIVHN